MQVSVFQLNKRSSYEFQKIQDKYSISLNRKLIAIADGTTQSFNSELWAEQVCKSFVNKTCPLNPIDFINAVTENASQFSKIKYEFSSNPAKAALERDKIKKGATCTFIGAELDSGNTLNVIAVGDSNIFIIRGNSILKYPFNSIEELDDNNYFLNTESLLANEVDKSFFYAKKLILEENDIIILATDALSRFFIKDPKRISTFLKLNSFDDFLQHCIDNWENKSLEEDDITAIVILNNSKKNKFNRSPASA